MYQQSEIGEDYQDRGQDDVQILLERGVRAADDIEYRFISPLVYSVNQEREDNECVKGQLKVAEPGNPPTQLPYLLKNEVRCKGNH